MAPQAQALILKIRDLAGELGALSDSMEKIPAAENYDYQVQTIRQKDD